MLKYVAQAGRVSQFIASKLQSSIAKNMLFPSSSDFKLPHLLPADDPAAALALPSFLAAISGGSFLEVYDPCLDCCSLGDLGDQF